MSTITVPMPDEDLAFLRSCSEKHGISEEEYIAQQAHNLREQLEKSLQPDVIAATGIIPSEIDAEKVYHEYLKKKYL